MGVRRSAIYITIAALFAAGCSSHGSQNAIPQIAPQSKAAAPRQIVAAAATTTAQYSVGISDVTTGGFLYEICDKNVWYTAPSTSPCAGNYAPPISGQKSISRSASFSAANCPSGAQPAQSGSCSLSMTMKASMGVFTDTGVTTVAPGSEADTTYTSQGQQSESVWNDVMTVNSTILPAGSTVKIAEREAVSGTFNLPCDMGDGDVSVYAAGGLDAWVQGSCNNGVFQWINGAGKSSMSETKAIKVTVGYTYSLSAQMNIILQASDCTTFCGPGGWLSETASVSNLVARTTYKPVTSGVTLTFASGAAY